MRHRLLLLGLALTALAVVPVGPASSAPPARQVDRPLGVVRGDGARIVDDLGRTVLLRGIT